MVPSLMDFFLLLLVIIQRSVGRTVGFGQTEVRLPPPSPPLEDRRPSYMLCTQFQLGRSPLPPLPSFLPLPPRPPICQQQGGEESVGTAEAVGS